MEEVSIKQLTEILQYGTESQAYDSTITTILTIVELTCVEPTFICFISL